MVVFDFVTNTLGDVPKAVIKTVARVIGSAHEQVSQTQSAFQIYCPCTVAEELKKSFRPRTLHSLTHMWSNCLQIFSFEKADLPKTLLEVVEQAKTDSVFPVVITRTCREEVFASQVEEGLGQLNEFSVFCVNDARSILIPVSVVGDGQASTNVRAAFLQAIESWEKIFGRPKIMYVVASLMSQKDGNTEDFQLSDARAIADELRPFPVCFIRDEEVFKVILQGNVVFCEANQATLLLERIGARLGTLKHAHDAQSNLTAFGRISSVMHKPPSLRISQLEVLYNSEMAVMRIDGWNEEIVKQTVSLGLRLGTAAKKARLRRVVAGGNERVSISSVLTI